jgi:hypothetical protein
MCGNLMPIVALVVAQLTYQPGQKSFSLISASHALLGPRDVLQHRVRFNSFLGNVLVQQILSFSIVLLQALNERSLTERRLRPQA